MTLATFQSWLKPRSPFENDASDLVILLCCDRFQLGLKPRSSVWIFTKIDFRRQTCLWRILLLESMVPRLYQATVTIEILGVWFCLFLMLRSMSTLAATQFKFMYRALNHTWKSHQRQHLGLKSPLDRFRDENAVRPRSQNFKNWKIHGHHWNFRRLILFISNAAVDFNFGRDSVTLRLS